MIPLLRQGKEIYWIFIFRHLFAAGAPRWGQRSLSYLGVGGVSTPINVYELF